MPRGSKPGERRGGRQRGVPNKKTALKNAAIIAAASNPEISPLEFLLAIMRDPNVSPDLRVKVAQVAAPFVHPKPASNRTGDPPPNRKLIEAVDGFAIDIAVAKALRDDKVRLYDLFQKRFAMEKHGGTLSTAEVNEESELRARISDRAKSIGCPVGYGPRQAGKDRDRLHHFFCKRISPPSCGNILTDAEDLEEAMLTARVAAFDESPEGRARRRIVELMLQSHCLKGLSAEEQGEYNGLRKIYLDEPINPDDRLKLPYEPLDRTRGGQAVVGNVALKAADD